MTSARGDGITLDLGRRYIRRNGTVTPPLVYPADVNDHFKSAFLFDTETGCFYDPNDPLFGMLVYAGETYEDGTLRTSGFDIIKELTKE